MLECHRVLRIKVRLGPGLLCLIQGVTEAHGGEVVVTISAGRVVNGEGSRAVRVPPPSPTRVSSGALGEEGGAEEEDVVGEVRCGGSDGVAVKDDWGKGGEEEFGPFWLTCIIQLEAREEAGHIMRKCGKRHPVDRDGSVV
jgi:hypothetical protein